MGPRRAAVLVGVTLLMAGHITLWVLTGKARTLSPVEPSESMYTLERGLVNAGFIFFALAILSTFVLGRWFCGWGCHIVALQDLCAWGMKKLGVKPKPFRSRLLVFAPLLLALYMFVWPTFKREALKPVLGEERWKAVAPWVGEAGERPKLQLAVLKQNFWETFPPWYIAAPFLALCGFGGAYFLGAKGYCTYGCPYGGFFAPIDRVAPGRILVTDACEHCGHCTSVCTSNVRVHEEVRDFGMVVDPGCMKCLDCVSVCPNDALYFGFATPPVAKTPARRRLYDTGLATEAVLAVLGLGLFMAYRGMAESVPMLMATGIASIGAFLCWKLWQLVREPSVRVQNVQLKLKGRVRPAGWALGVVTVAMLAGGAWGGMVNYDLWRAQTLLGRMTVPLTSVLAPGFVAPAGEKELAERASAHLVRAAAPSRGGWGWDRRTGDSAQLAYLNLVTGDLAGAELWLNRTIDDETEQRGKPSPDPVRTLARVMEMRGGQPPEALARYRTIVNRAPGSAEARLLLAHLLLVTGDAAGSAEEAKAAAAADPTNAQTSYEAGVFLARNLERADLALPAFEQAARAQPAFAGGWVGVGLSLAEMGRFAEAEPKLREALRLEPENAGFMQFLARDLRELGRAEEATELERRANEVGARGAAPGAGR